VTNLEAAQGIAAEAKHRERNDKERRSAESASSRPDKPKQPTRILHGLSFCLTFKWAAKAAGFAAYLWNFAAYFYHLDNQISWLV
jgi:hypothetical protein